MLHREKDVYYCGVRPEVIKDAKPTINKEVLHNLYEFIHTRYDIHKKKDVEKLPPPWTTNPIFLQVKFTNVRREHDRESRNVIDNICSKTEYSLKDRFFNIILMRFWNKYESYKLATGGQLLKFPLSDDDFNECLKRIDSNDSHTWWSGAYYTCPVRSWLERVHFQKKIPPDQLNFSQSPIYFAKYALTDELWGKIEAAASPQDVFEILTAIPWMGNFLVYQWFIDFTYCEDYWFSENEFVVSGPGCTKGINLLFEDRDGMTHEECLFWMRDNQNETFNSFGYNPNELFDDLPEYDRYINLMSWENIFCELQKFIKCTESVKIGKKPRGKSNYDGLGNKTKKVASKVNLFDLGE